MSVLSPIRCIALALAAALNTACAQGPSSDKAEKEAAMTENSAESRTVDGYTYTTHPVEARIGPHRFAFPANYYDDQIGPAVGGGVGLTFLWPSMEAAQPGSRTDRSMEDQYRSVVVSIDHVDKTPIGELLERLTTTDPTTAEGSLSTRDPLRRLDQRVAGEPTMGLTPYLIDEAKIPAFAAAFEQETGLPYKGDSLNSDDWYISQAAGGPIETFIKCDSRKRMADGLTIEGNRLVSQQTGRVAACTHYFVDVPDSLAIRMNYSRAVLADWKRMESDLRAALARYKVK